MHLVAQNVQDTHAIATKLAERLVAALPQKTAATVVALSGDLGAGKTTFTQGFAIALGIQEKPKSPTFLLAKRYEIPHTRIPGAMHRYFLWHLDCYRLNGRQDLVALDLHSAFLDPKNIILVEWPERIGDALPRDHIEVHMTHEGGEKRGITIKE